MTAGLPGRQCARDLLALVRVEGDVAVDPAPRQQPPVDDRRPRLDDALADPPDRPDLLAVAVGEPVVDEHRRADDRGDGGVGWLDAVPVLDGDRSAVVGDTVTPPGQVCVLENGHSYGRDERPVAVQQCHRDAEGRDAGGEVVRPVEGVDHPAVVAARLAGGLVVTGLLGPDRVVGVGLPQHRQHPPFRAAVGRRLHVPGPVFGVQRPVHKAVTGERARVGRGLTSGRGERLVGLSAAGCRGVAHTGVGGMLPRVDFGPRTPGDGQRTAGFLPPARTAGMNVFAVDGLPEVEPGDDLAAMVAKRVDLRPDDVVCVASTVVSKAEDRRADLAEYEAGERARAIATQAAAEADEGKDPRFAQAVIEASEELLMDRPIMLAVTPFGHITVNAGVDRSNVPGADLLLLPEDPTASAERLREGLDTRVVVTDTSGRPFRYGQRGVALGWAGLPAARDWRGERDREGREMEATVQTVVDELAGAANLVTGEGAGGTPVAVVRDFEFGDHAGDDDLFRTPDDDLIRPAVRAYYSE